MDGYSTTQAKGAGMPDHASASKMSEAAPAKAPEGTWELEDIRARTAENGGVIVTCAKRRKDPPEKASYEQTYQSKDYAFTNTDEALAYIAQELGSARGSSGGGLGVPATRG